MINYQTILSNYNKRGTLLKWLRTLQTALEEGALETVTTTTTDNSVVFHFGFADGTSVDSPPIQLEAGPQGPEGPEGPEGPQGPAATIAVGTVTTLPAGSSATVVNSGTSGAAVFDFGLPEGDTGPQGEDGPQGPAATIAIGTVSTLPAGSSATVVNSGTSGAAVFDFGIPQGQTGAAGGITNIDGYAGAVTTGSGVSLDALTGKLSSYDFNLSNTGTLVMDFTGISNISKAGGDFSYALNYDGSIGKIYGAVVFNVASGVSGSTTVDIPTNLYVTAPDTEYIINGGSCLTYVKSDDSIYSTTFYTPVFKIDTSGRVYVRASRIDRVPGGKIFYGAPACIYFFKNFGDE